MRTRFFVPLATALLLAGCHTSFRFIQDGGTTYREQGGHIEVTHVVDGERFHLELETESEATDDYPYQVFEVIDISPWSGEATLESVRWAFALVEPRSALRFDDGTVIEHPDLARRAALLALLDGPSPDVAGAIGGLPELLRRESRREVFIACARLERLSPTDVGRLTGVIAEGNQGPLIAAASDGTLAGGPTSSTLFACSDELARRDALTVDHYDVIAGAARSIGSSSYQSRLLVDLAPRASVAAVLDANRAIGSSSGKSTVLKALIERPGLSGSEADAIADATRAIGSSTHQGDVLTRLVGKASTDAIVAATSSIGSSTRKHDVLIQLARSHELSAGEYDQIAEATVRVGSSSYQSAVLRELVGKATTATILGASHSIGSSTRKYEVIDALAAQPLSSADYDAIATSTRSIGSSSYQGKALVELVGKASTRAILDATGAIGSSTAKHEVLKTLASQRGLTLDEADRIAATSMRIGSSSSQADVLVMLVGKASVDAILQASRHVGSTHRRFSVFSALVDSEIDRSEADAIVEATPQLSSSSNQEKILARLIGRASTTRIEQAIRHVGSRSGQERLRTALGDH